MLTAIRAAWSAPSAHTGWFACSPTNADAIKMAYTTNPTKQINVIVCDLQDAKGETALGWSLYPMSQDKDGKTLSPISKLWCVNHKSCRTSPFSNWRQYCGIKTVYKPHFIL